MMGATPHTPVSLSCLQGIFNHLLIMQFRSLRIPIWQQPLNNNQNKMCAVNQRLPNLVERAGCFTVFNCPPDVLWLLVFYDSSSRCHGLVFSVWLCYFMIIRTYCFPGVPFSFLSDCYHKYAIRTHVLAKWALTQLIYSDGLVPSYIIFK